MLEFIILRYLELLCISWQPRNRCLDAKIKLEYLPWYSPDYNSIEEAFVQLKAWMKKNYILAEGYEAFKSFLEAGLQYVDRTSGYHFRWNSILPYHGVVWRSRVLELNYINTQSRICPLASAFLNHLICVLRRTLILGLVDDRFLIVSCDKSNCKLAAMATPFTDNKAWCMPTKWAHHNGWIVPVWREWHENVVFQFPIVKNRFEVGPAQSYGPDCKLNLICLFLFCNKSNSS